MHKTIWPVIGLLVVLTACGSNSGISNALHGTNGTSAQQSAVTSASDTAQLGSTPVYHETPEDVAGWQQLESNPGRPGIDYNPQQLMITFLPNGQLPVGWVSASPQAAASASSASNAILRPIKRFEPLAAALAERYGVKLDGQIYMESLLMANLVVPEGLDPAKLLTRIRTEAKGLVAHATYEPLRHMDYTPTDPDFTAGNAAGTDYSAQWGTHRVRATDAWDYTLGDPTIEIGVCDTGVRATHEELAGQVIDTTTIASSNCDIPDNNKDTSDVNGHGTYVSGLCVSKGDDGKTIIGLASHCKVLPIRIADASGSAQDNWIAAGCLLADSLGCRAINLSFGGPSPDPNLQSMVNTIAGHGKFLGIAAGNDGVTTPAYPGFYSDICVGATGDGSPSVDNRAPYSNFGSYVDIAAPGSFLKSTTFNSDTSYSSPPDYESGTSFATPLVVSGAALLLSYDPTLTRAQLITALETTGDPTVGFDGTHTVLRMNLANAFASVAKVSVKAPEPTQLVQSGVITLTPTVNARAKSIDCKFNGVLVGSLSAAPWDFTIDTTSIDFGTATVQFIAHDGADSATSTLQLLIDNTVGAYPLMENFTAGDPTIFTGIDAKAYSAGVITALNSWPAGTWTADAVASNGPGAWSTKVPGGFSGTGAYCGQGGNTYGAYELDALVSRKVSLTGVANPTLVFHHHFNVEDGGSAFDKVRVLVTADNGKTFTEGKLPTSGLPSEWTGYQATYGEADVDLSAFVNKTVNIVLLFQSDGLTAGENTSQPAGWWVDSLVVSRNYSTNVPTIGGVVVANTNFPAGLPAVSAQPVVGKAVGATSFDVTLTAPSQVNKALYWLDLAPYGSIDLYDPVGNSTAGPDFKCTLNVPNKKNQDAILHVQYFDAQNNPGPEVDMTVHLFNLRGDTNADGTVSQPDLDGYAGKIGLASGDPGYSVFFDTDLDGLITEADASGVGYNWGKSS